jgi:hypothetical protein
MRDDNYEDTTCKQIRELSAAEIDNVAGGAFENIGAPLGSVPTRPETKCNSSGVCHTHGFPGH